MRERVHLRWAISRRYNVIIQSILVILAYFVLWYVVSLLTKNAGVVDIAWGFGFVVVAISGFFKSWWHRYACHDFDCAYLGYEVVDTYFQAKCGGNQKTFDMRVLGVNGERLLRYSLFLGYLCFKP